MMLKESVAQTDDPDGALERPVLIIKEVHVAYPLQRTVLATANRPTGGTGARRAR